MGTCSPGGLAAGPNKVLQGRHDRWRILQFVPDVEVRSDSMDEDLARDEDGRPIPSSAGRNRPSDRFIWLLGLVLVTAINSCQSAAPDIEAATSAAKAVLQGVDGAIEDHDSLLYLARIDAVLMAAGLGSSEESVRTRLDTLWQARYTSESGGPGWGLPYAWDAFGDGTTNPDDTIYTYTTAMAALAFLDGYVALGDKTQLERAKAAVDTILSDCWGYVGGDLMSVWYSNQQPDQLDEPYVVHNVNALTLAAIARIARYDDPSYESEKRNGMEAMLHEHSGFLGVEGQWKYQIGGRNRNDLVHHAYIALGLVEAGMPEAEAAMQYMWSTWFDTTTGSFDADDREVMGSTAWGPGDALLPLTSDARWHPEAALLTHQLLAEVDESGIPTVADRSQPRSTVRYGLGPALYAASAAGAGDLLPAITCEEDC